MGRSDREGDGFGFGKSIVCVGRVEYVSDEYAYGLRRV